MSGLWAGKIIVMNCQVSNEQAGALNKKMYKQKEWIKSTYRLDKYY